MNPVQCHLEVWAERSPTGMQVLFFFSFWCHIWCKMKLHNRHRINIASWNADYRRTSTQLGESSSRVKYGGVKWMLNRYETRNEIKRIQLPTARVLTEESYMNLASAPRPQSLKPINAQASWRVYGSTYCLWLIATDVGLEFSPRNFRVWTLINSQRGYSIKSSNIKCV